MRTHSLCQGRAAALVLPLCLCVASACSDEPQSPAGPIEVPLGAPLPPLQYTMSLTFNGPSGGQVRPESVSGHLYVDVAADGQVSGAMSAKDLYTSDIDRFTGRVEGTEIVVDPTVLPGGGLRLSELRIAVLDQDGDGTIDGAEGEASGYWSYAAGGDILRFHEVTAVLTAGPDTTASTATLGGLGGYPEFLPYEGVSIGFQEPLREADVRDNLRVLANGAPIPGELDLSSYAGMVGWAAFEPDGFLPFGAELTLDFGDLKDPSGNALIPSEAREIVVADPGVFTDNAGFESGLGGWLAIGEAGALGTFQGFAPVEGAAHAVIRVQSMLFTYLDVPAEATALDLSLTVLFEDSYASPGTVKISLYPPSREPVVVFDNRDVQGPAQPCSACTEFEAALGPVRPSVDLTPYRGQRVFLTIGVHPTGVHAENEGAALVDDIQLR